MHELCDALTPPAELYVTEPGPRPATAVVCIAPELSAGDRFSVLAIYDVDENVRWDEPIEGAVHSMFAFFHAAPGLDRDDFARRYREHADVARVHHPGIRRYVQDIVTAQEAEERWRCDAISELHFAGPEEYRDRFWLGDESREIVARDVERFSDASSAKAVVAARLRLD